MKASRHDEIRWHCPHVYVSDRLCHTPHPTPHTRRQEWWIHRHLLHGGWAWLGSSIHQQHHELPFYHISIDPPPVVLAWGAAACAVALALLPQPLAWTVLGVRDFRDLPVFFFQALQSHAQPNPQEATPGA